MVILSRDVLLAVVDKLMMALDRSKKDSKKGGAADTLQSIRIILDNKLVNRSLILSASSRFESAERRILDFQCDGNEPGFHIAISGSYLKSILDNTPKGTTLSIHISDVHVIISDGRSSFRLTYLREDSLPPQKHFDPNLFTSFNPMAFVTDLARVYVPTWSKEDINSPYAGVIINQKHFVSCGQRGVYMNLIKNETLPVNCCHKITDVAAQKIISLFSKSTESGGFCDAAHHFALVSDDFFFKTLLAAGPVPEYKRVLPKTTRQMFTLDKKEMVTALKRVLILSDSGRIRLRIREGDIALRSEGVHGKAEESIPCQSNIDCTVEINGALILDALSRLREDSAAFSMDLDGPRTPIIIKEGGFLSAISPSSIRRG